MFNHKFQNVLQVKSRVTFFNNAVYHEIRLEFKQRQDQIKAHFSIDKPQKFKVLEISPQHVTLGRTNCEEDKQDDATILQMKDHCPDLTTKTTAFFVRGRPNQVIKEITETLEKHQTEYVLSPKAWKLTFKKRRELLTTR